MKSLLIILTEKVSYQDIRSMRKHDDSTNVTDDVGRHKLMGITQFNFKPETTSEAKQSNVLYTGEWGMLDVWVRRATFNIFVMLKAILP